MTIKFEYKCDTCEHNYVEQRGNDEPNPYFTICNNCGTGQYQEINQTVLAPEPERSTTETVIEVPNE